MSERHVTVEIIIAAVSAATGVHRLDILSDNREADVARARYAAIWISKQMLPLGSVTLGRVFGDRDHSTILRALERADELRASDPSFRLLADIALGTLQAIERNGLIRLAETIDPLATARRVLANPRRESVRVSAHEIIALCQTVAETFGGDPAQSPELENSDAA